jgi:hypothetical protein
MPPARLTLSMRGTVVALAVAITGVLALDATAIVAAPTGSRPAATPQTASPVTAALPLLSWSGQLWLVYPANSYGPDGYGTLSDSHDAVHVDAKGRLHLKITKVHGAWRGAQLELLNPINYGKYSFVVGSATAKLAKPIVLGMFVYKPATKAYTDEIDLEDSKSLIGLGYPRDAQYVVQPYKIPSHIHRYKIKKKYSTTRQQFTWHQHKVDFVTRAGKSKHAKKLASFSYHGPAVPDPSNEHVYINLHLHTKHPPTNGKRHVILDSFTYTGSS